MKTKIAVPLVAASVGILAVAAFASAQGRNPKASAGRAAPARARAGGAVLKEAPRADAIARADATARAEQLVAHQGTKIGPRPNAVGDDLRIHKDIAARFAAQDPAASAARIGHFTWLNDPETRCNGWYGVIQDVTPTPGGLTVAVRVSPILRNEKLMSINTSYYVVETYELKGGRLSLLGVEGPPPGTLKALMTD